MCSKKLALTSTIVTFQTVYTYKLLLWIYGGQSLLFCLVLPVVPIKGVNVLPSCPTLSEYIPARAEARLFCGGTQSEGLARSLKTRFLKEKHLGITFTFQITV